MDLFQYATEHNYKRVGTSEAAAKRASWDSNKLRKNCFDMLYQRGPSTADEIAAALGEHWIRIRPRCAELSRLGLIKDSGLRRPSAMGNSSIVWEIVGKEIRLPLAA